MRMLGPTGGCFLLSGPGDEGSWLQAKSQPPLWQFPFAQERSTAISCCLWKWLCVPVITQVIKEGRESPWGQSVHLETWPRITIRDSHMAEPSVQVMETQDTSLFKKTGFIDVAILGYESELDTEKHVKSIPAE